MSYCSECNFILNDTSQSTIWVHNIIYHQEKFEEQIIGLTKEQIIDGMCDVTKKLFFDEQ